MGKWVKKKLGEIGDIITGSTPTTSKLDYWNGDYNFYSPADFTDNIYCDKTERTVTIEGLNVGRCIPENSIMVACIASIGKIAINKTKGITNQQINSIIPFDEFNYLFLYYLLLHKSSAIKNGAAQTTIPIINKEDFSNLEVTIPSSLSEQRRIASILSSADKVIDSTQKLIAKYKSIKQGMMEDLLKPKEGWKKVKLGECCTRLCNGMTYDIEEKEGYMVTRIETISDGVIDLAKIGHTSIMPKIEYKLQKGDILFSHINSLKHIGKIAYCNGDVELYHGMNLLVIRVNENIDSKYLYYQLSFDDVRTQIRTLAKSAVNQASINTTELQKFEINIPISCSDIPVLSEQRRIASILSSIDVKIESEEKVLEKYKKIKKGLMEKLLKEEEV